jgi:hypothetical protein
MSGRQKGRADWQNLPTESTASPQISSERASTCAVGQPHAHHGACSTTSAARWARFGTRTKGDACDQRGGTLVSASRGGVHRPLHRAAQRPVNVTHTGIGKGRQVLDHARREHRAGIGFKLRQRVEEKRLLVLRQGHGAGSSASAPSVTRWEPPNSDSNTATRSRGRCPSYKPVRPINAPCKIFTRSPR